MQRERETTRQMGSISDMCLRDAPELNMFKLKYV